MSYYKDFGITKTKEDLSKELLHNLTKPPEKENKDDMPHFDVREKGALQQADLLYLPHDGDYKYALVVVDVGSGETEAEPLETKESKEVLEAFKKIYRRKVLKLPQNLSTDPGSEFRGDVERYFTNLGVRVKYGKTGRHRQQAIVENRNKVIGKALLKRQLAQEILTGEEETRWVKDLPVIINAINNKVRKRKPKNDEYGPPVLNKKTELLDEGTKVRAKLEFPINIVTGKKLGDKFRAADVRFDPKIRTVKKVLLIPEQPPMYVLDGKEGRDKIEHVGYTRQQLRVVPKNEKPPPLSVVRGNPKKWAIKEIADKKKEKNRIYYLVKWVAGDETWVPQAELMKTAPILIEDYNNTHSE